jgi:hypothetical protein
MHWKRSTSMCKRCKPHWPGGERTGGSHLFLVDGKETRYVDCKDQPLPSGAQLVDDVLNRTKTAMPQAHYFMAMELALGAPQQPRRVSFEA